MIDWGLGDLVGKSEDKIDSIEGGNSVHIFGTFHGILSFLFSSHVGRRTFSVRCFGSMQRIFRPLDFSLYVFLFHDIFGRFLVTCIYSSGKLLGR